MRKRTKRVLLALLVVTQALSLSAVGIASDSLTVAPKTATTNSEMPRGQLPQMNNDAVILLIGNANALVNGKKAQIDSENANVVPIIDSDRTMVPIRFVSESLGADVQWVADENKAIIKTATKTAVLTLGSNIMKINDKTFTMDVSVQSFNERILVPVRTIAENILDKKVSYSNGLVYISDNDTQLDDMMVNVLTGIISGKGGPGGGEGVIPTPDTSWIKQKWSDIPYATISEAEKLDIYLPNDGTGPFPVIVSIHGGAFIGGDKNDGQVVPMLEGLKRGYAVVSINYRLSGEATIPAQINDVKAAIRFLRANASKYNINPDKIAAWGGSAGANLAALAGTSGGVKELEDLSLGNSEQSSSVQAVVDWFGPINFLTMDDQFKQSGIQGQVHNTIDSPESKLLGKLLTEAPELVNLQNPETFISSDDPAFFIQHGTKDALVPAQQSVGFAAKLTEVIGTDKVSFELLEGATHGDAMFSTANNVKKVFDFLDKYLK